MRCMVDANSVIPHLCVGIDMVEVRIEAADTESVLD